MNILFINNFFAEFGGAEKIMLKEAEFMENEGHEVHYFSVGKKPYFKDYEYSKFFPDFLDYRKLSKFQALTNIFRPFYNKNSAKNLDNLLKTVKPDIVHIHNIHYHLTPSVLKIIYKHKIPTVMTLHDIRMFCPSGTLAQGSGKICNEKFCIKKNPAYCLINKCKNNNIKETAIALAEYIFSKSLGFYNGIDKFITPSKALYELARESGIQENRLEHINNFIDESYFESSPLYSDKGYFLYAGRLSREKGVHFLLKAMKILPEARLKIAGTGTQEQELKQLAQNLNLNNVEFLGNLDKKQLMETYNGCISTVLPCNWFEIFGLTLAESLSLGKPVIASNLGAIPEIIEDGKTGIVIKPAKPEKIAESIKKLIQNRELVYEMGKNGRKKAEELYTPQLHFEKLLNLYKELL